MAIKHSERKSLRLPGFDYSQAGAYFVTLCSYDKKCVFGNIADARMRTNKLGTIVTVTWERLPQVLPFIALDNWVIMPNHLHGIIWLKETNPANKSLSAIIRLFKSNSTLQARKAFGERLALWQRGFYEHVIRDEKDLFRIRQYIKDNPAQWAVDSENPEFKADEKRKNNKS